MNIFLQTYHIAKINLNIKSKFFINYNLKIIPYYIMFKTLLYMFSENNIYNLRTVRYGYQFSRFTTKEENRIPILSKTAGFQ